MTDLHPETLAVHAGCEPDPTTNARITPIYQTASYVFDSPDHAANLFSLSEFGNIYSRIMNPTNDALEKKVAALEGGVGALGVASGHAAQLIAFHTLMEPGCNIVAARKLYGGSLNQMGEAFLKFGWETRFVDADDPENIRAAMDDKTRCVFIESLANPGGVVLGDDALFGQHLGMGHRPGDVLPVEAPVVVEGNGIAGGILFHQDYFRRCCPYVLRLMGSNSISVLLSLPVTGSMWYPRDSRAVTPMIAGSSSSPKTTVTPAVWPS